MNIRVEDTFTLHVHFDILLLSVVYHRGYTTDSNNLPDIIKK